MADTQAKVKDAALIQLRGRNGGATPYDIDDVQLAELVNWIPRPRAHLELRPGYSRVTSTAYAEAINGLFSYSADAETRTLVVGAASTWAKLSGTQLVEIPAAAGVSISSNAYPWRFAQYKTVLYGVRKSTGTLKRSTLSSIQDAGIAAPTTAPTLTQGAAGDLDAGDYRGVYTYYNTATGAESDYSPESSALTLAASKKINWSAIVNSTNPQVDAIRLYRTLPDQEGQYFLVDQIDNFTSTYTDNDIIAALGDRASTRNGLPPSNVELLAVFQQRLFLSDGVDLYFSETLKAESYGSTAIIKVYPDDGHRIVQLVPFGSRLIVAKSNAVHYVTGSSASTFDLKTLADRDGCYGDSMRTAAGYLFWLTGKGGKVIQSQGSGVKDISTPRVKDLLKRINSSARSAIAAGVAPKENRYYLHLPLDAATTPSHTLVYDWEEDEWHVEQWNSNTEAPVWADSTFDSNGDEVLYGAFTSANHVVDLLDPDATDDVGADIIGSFTSKGFMMDEPGKEHGVFRVGVLTHPQMSGSLDLYMYLNGDSTAHKSRTGISTDVKGWQIVSLSGADDSSAATQIRVDYTGKTGINFMGLTLKLTQLGRGAPLV